MCCPFSNQESSLIKDVSGTFRKPFCSPLYFPEQEWLFVCFFLVPQQYNCRCDCSCQVMLRLAALATDCARFAAVGFRPDPLRPVPRVLLSLWLRCVCGCVLDAGRARARPAPKPAAQEPQSNNRNQNRNEIKPYNLNMYFLRVAALAFLLWLCSGCGSRARRRDPHSNPHHKNHSYN